MMISAKNCQKNYPSLLKKKDAEKNKMRERENVLGFLYITIKKENLSKHSSILKDKKIVVSILILIRQR